MARDLGPKCRICRREGMKLFLKGERCLTEKCAIERRSYPPGEHGRGRIKQSEYLLQLREKQKARRYYGLLEKQFRTYYEKASKRSGVTGEELLRMLETRLDNVVYHLGFANTRAAAGNPAWDGGVTWVPTSRGIDGGKGQDGIPTSGEIAAGATMLLHPSEKVCTNTHKVGDTLTAV